MTPIRIFVASDSRMRKAELALEESIRQNTKSPYTITWMRAGDPGWKVSDYAAPDTWDIGRLPGKPYTSPGWATDFTCFRFTIPELCGFQGLAIYIDVDFICLRDLSTVWKWSMPRPIVSPDGRTDMMLINCGSFFGQKWWPSITDMQRSGHTIGQYRRLLMDKDFLAIGPSTWESWDGRGWNGRDGESSNYYCIHYTNMRTQPWKPWPEAFSYPESHPDARADAIFWRYYDHALSREELHDDDNNSDNPDS